MKSKIYADEQKKPWCLWTENYLKRGVIHVIKRVEKKLQNQIQLKLTPWQFLSVARNSYTM